MTRPKVEPNRRKRTANACSNCRRRKSKCNGATRCNRCIRSNDVCVYPFQASFRGSSDEPPANIHHAGDCEALLRASGALPPLLPRQMPCAPHTAPRQGEPSFQQMAGRVPPPPPPPPPPPQSPPQSQLLLHTRDSSVSATSAESITSSSVSSSMDYGESEPQEATVSRMLLIEPSRPVILGQSATLKFLQLVRRQVEVLVGKSDFTEDGNQVIMVEPKVTVSRRISIRESLPLEKSPDIVWKLAEIFRRNTRAFFDMFAWDGFCQTVDMMLGGQQLQPLDLCRVRLVLAIGLVMDKDSSEQDFEHAEMLHDQARRVQALIPELSGGETMIMVYALRSLYLLVVCRRNEAWYYAGSAIRLGVAAGIDNPAETAELISGYVLKQEKVLNAGIGLLRTRCNLWKSLFVLETFLSALVGRPPTMSGACADHGWDRPTVLEPLGAGAVSLMLDAGAKPGMTGLDQAVQASRLTHQMLTHVYAVPEKTELLEETMLVDRIRYIADEHRNHCSFLAHQADLGANDVHLRLLRYNSTILLSRPKFYLVFHMRWRQLCQMQTLHAAKPSSPAGSEAESTASDLTAGSKQEVSRSLSEACVEASSLTVHCAWEALEGGCCSRRDPFLIAFVFLAILVLMSNEIVLLHENPGYDECVSKAILFLETCASQPDPQAERLLYIVKEFSKDVEKYKKVLRNDGNFESLYPPPDPQSWMDSLGFMMLQG